MTTVKERPVRTPAPEPAGAGRRLPWGRALMAVLIGGTTVLMLYPVAMAVLGSLMDRRPGQRTGGFSFDGWVAAYTDSRTYIAWVDTLTIGVATVAIAGIAGALLAWIVCRTDTPGRGVFRTLLLLPLFVPTVLIGMAWTIGVGALERSVAGTPFAVLVPGAYSMTGVVLSLSLVAIPLVYILMLPSFDAMDANLEQAASTSGAGPLRTARRVTIPLMAPALLGAMILAGVRVMETLDIPLMIGRPAGVEVFSTRMYESIFRTPTPDYAKATALGVSLGVLAAVLVVLNVRYLSRRSFVTVGGRGGSRQRVELGRFRYLTAALCWLYLLVGVVAPIGIVTYGSFESFIGLWDGNLTLEHWSAAVLADPVFRRAVLNTVLLGAAGAVVMTLIGCLCAYFIVRGGGQRLRKLVEGITWVPWGTPAVLLALGILWGYTLVPGLYGSVWLLLIAYVTVYVPLAVRQFTASLLQLDPSLEQAGWTSGAGRLRSFWALSRPLLLPTAASSMLLSFILVTREVSMSAFLTAPGSEVLGVLALDSWTRGGASQAAVYGVCMIMISGAALVLFGLVNRGLAARLAGER